MKIAPYMAQSVTRSYLRQQRVGERIAEARAPDQPAAEINISQAAREAAETESARPRSERLLTGDRAEQIERLSGRFADILLKSSANDAAEEAEEKEALPLDRFLESLGLAVMKDEDGEGESIIRKDSGEVLASLSQENREEIRSQIQDAARRVLEGLT